MLEFDFENVVKEIRGRNAKTVAVQLPEGLKDKALEIVKRIEKDAVVTVATFVDPCFGACDLADERAKNIGAEVLVHFGHTKFLQSKFPTVYVPLKYKINEIKLRKVEEKLLEKIGALSAKKVALCTTAQYLHYLEELKKELEKRGVKIFVGEGRGVEKGQLLGCNYSAVKAVQEKVDAVVYFGDGLFHPLGVVFSTQKEVIVANPLSGEVKILKEEKEKFLRKRFAAIAVAREGKNFGILVSTKKGQLRFGKAVELKKKIETNGKKAFVLVSDFIKAEHILGMQIDVLVNTACPRIATDDGGSFKMPVISASELLIVLGEKKFEDYKVEEII